MKIVLAAAGALALTTPAFAQHAGHDQAAAANVTAPTAGAQGTGTIKAVDLKAGAITLHHGPIAALKWPAMTMTFKASPEVLKTAKAGKTVTFTLNAAADEVVAIR
jgi:Cu(I)/Ag(I) efflux system periplasmic protein CusF